MIHQFTKRIAVPLLALLLPTAVLADSKEVIDAQAAQALDRLRDYNGQSAELLSQAKGVLIFPDVVKMGFGVGGQYGEGVLQVDGEPVAYYSTAGASFGLQLGAQYKSEVLLFMTDTALTQFRESRGWEVGVDGSVAVIQLGAGGKFDSKQLTQPVIAFIFSNQGLMYNLTLEGSKITRIAR